MRFFAISPYKNHKLHEKEENVPNKTSCEKLNKTFHSIYPSIVMLMRHFLSDTILFLVYSYKRIPLIVIHSL